MSDDELLPLLDDRTRLLALTEPLHLQQHIPRLRNALLTRLVERAGYRSIAVESCCLRGARLDAVLARGVEPDRDTVQSGFSHGFGDAAASRELAAWIGARNRTAGPADRVRFSGFDAPMEMAGADSPRDALGRVHGFLRDRGLTGLPAQERIEALLGPDQQWSDPAVIMDPARGIGGDPAAGELAVLAEDLAARLSTTAPDGPDDTWWDAATAARAAVGLLTYHRLLADDRPGRTARACAHRDAMMAANLAATVERERGRGPTLVFAHHGHLRRGPTTMTLDVDITWYGAGALLAPRLGPELTVLCTVIGAARGREIGVPEPGTVEHALLAAHPVGAVLTADRARQLAEGAVVRDAGPAHVGYFPADAALLSEVDLVWLVPELDS